MGIPGKSLSHSDTSDATPGCYNRKWSGWNISHVVFMICVVASLGKLYCDYCRLQNIVDEQRRTLDEVMKFCQPPQEPATYAAGTFDTGTSDDERPPQDILPSREKRQAERGSRRSRTERTSEERKEQRQSERQGRGKLSRGNKRKKQKGGAQNDRRRNRTELHDGYHQNNTFAISLFGNAENIDANPGPGAGHIHRDTVSGNVKFNNTGGRLILWKEDMQVKNYATEHNLTSMKYNLTTGEVTIPVPGVYLIYSQVTVFGQVTYYESTQAIASVIYTETHEQRKRCSKTGLFGHCGKALAKCRETLVVTNITQDQYRTCSLQRVAFLDKDTRVWIADDVNSQMSSRMVVFDELFTFWGIVKWY